jgi:hypothetical protein
VLGSPLGALLNWAREITCGMADLTFSDQALGRETLGAFSLAEMLSVAAHEAGSWRRKDIHVIGIAETSCRKREIGLAHYVCDPASRTTPLGGMTP